MKNWENRTLRYYTDNLDSFFGNTLAADMSEARNKFLDALPKGAYILDFGCGSGRDTKAFLEAGYLVDATDGSYELCEKASEYTGIQVKQLLFQELNAIDTYDGVWACASILHLPKEELKEVIRKISTALKQNGVLYTSFKYGVFEGVRQDRYFTDFTKETLTDFWADISSFQIFDTWITQDVRPGREEEQWINLLARRI